MKRISIALLMIVITGSAFAQSKKELQAEISRLKSQVRDLQGRIDTLTAPATVDFSTSSDKASYCLGVMIGSNISAQGFDSLEAENFMAALQDVFAKRELKYKPEEASMVVQQYMRESMERKSRKAREEGMAFLSENRTKEGVKVTASGLQYKILNEGTGKSPSANSSVTVHYVGNLLNGYEFDSSVRRGQPATFNLQQVIRGWTEGLQLLKEGGKAILYVPSELGYGERGAGAQIPPNSTLIFEVELIKVN